MTFMLPWMPQHLSMLHPKCLLLVPFSRLTWTVLGCTTMDEKEQAPCVHATHIAPIQHVFRHTTDIHDTFSDAPFSVDEDQAFLCHALAACLQRYFWCLNDSHQLSKCPLAATVFGNPSAHRVIHSWLQPPSSRRSAPLAATEANHNNVTCESRDATVEASSKGSGQPRADPLSQDKPCLQVSSNSFELGSSSSESASQ